MCGLFFHLSQSDSVDTKRFKSAFEKMHPRGPDNQSTYFKENLALAHARLRIIDPSEIADQPMWSDDGRFVILFNGEIYNFRELRVALEKKGCCFRTRSDTEVLFNLCLIEEIDAALSKIRGMFSFVLFDMQTGTGKAVRDHFGQKPLFYSHSQERITLSSGIESIRYLHGYTDPNLDAYQVFLSTRGIVLPDQTFFNKIRTLPAGHILEFDNTECSVRRFFNPSSLIDQEQLLSQSNLCRDHVKKKLDDHLSIAIERHVVSDVPVGVLLSGGIDSSLAYWYASENCSDLTCFTKVSPGIEEIPQDVVPKILESRPSSSVMSVQQPKGYLEECNDLIRWSGFPPPWGGGAPMNRLCVAARDRGVTVLLGGDCADEYWAGYESVHQTFSNFSGDFFDFGKQVSVISDEIVFRPLAVEKYLTYQREVRSELLEIFGFINSPKERFMHASLFHDSLVFFQCCTLPHSDAYSMKASVELRNPYLDLDLVKFVLNLPLGYRYEQKGESVQLKALLKELAIEKFGSLLNVRKEGTRNFSMAISDATYWNIQNFSLNDIFPIDKNNLNRKLLFRLVCLELFHRNFILQENAFLPVLLTDEGRAALL